MTTPHRSNKHEDTPFSRWLRKHPDLDSVKHSISASDCDFIIHRYRNMCDGRSEKDLQCIMLVEVKTAGAKPRFAQRDTLKVLDYLLRAGDRKILTSETGKRYRLRSFGVHFLTMDGVAPDTSKNINWDGKKIDERSLVNLFRFDLHPDNLTPNPLRNHHRARSKPTLFGEEIRRRDK